LKLLRDTAFPAQVVSTSGIAPPRHRASHLLRRRRRRDIERFHDGLVRPVSRGDSHSVDAGDVVLFVFAVEAIGPYRPFHARRDLDHGPVPHREHRKLFDERRQLELPQHV
jgi:hypothetical protein